MKRLVAMLLTLSMLLSLTACGVSYEDTNGANNFALQSITDEDIILLQTGASGLTYKESNLGLLSSSEYTSRKFNGVEQLYLTNFVGPSDIFIYIGHLEVTAGNFRLVVINNDEIIFDIPLDSFGEEFYFEDLTGTFSIHVAGESAAFSFYMDVY